MAPESTCGRCQRAACDEEACSCNLSARANLGGLTYSNPIDRTLIPAMSEVTMAALRRRESWLVYAWRRWFVSVWRRWFA